MMHTEFQSLWKRGGVKRDRLFVKLPLRTYLVGCPPKNVIVWINSDQSREAVL